MLQHSLQIELFYFTVRRRHFFIKQYYISTLRKNRAGIYNTAESQANKVLG